MIHKLIFTRTDSPKKRAIFFDRDGVINQEPPDYVKRWEEFKFNPEIFSLLNLIDQNKYHLIIVTNQRGIARELMTHQHFEDITLRMISKFVEQGIFFDAVYYCPHNHNQCDCRKPHPGMFHEAKKDFQLSMEESLMIGNSDHDLTAAQSAGIKKLIKIPTDSPSDALNIVRNLKL